MTTLHGPPLDAVEGIGALTLGSFCEDVAARFGAHEAVVFDDPLRGGATTRWTYAELHGEARAVARALLALGLERGERVAVLMGNRPEAVASLFGAAMAGAVVVPLSTFAPKPELAFMLRRAEVAVVLSQARMGARRFEDDVEELRPDLPVRAVAAVGSPSWDELLAGGSGGDEAAVDARLAATAPSDPGVIIFSSGTTSTPKGMLHTHRAPTLQFWLQAGIFRRHPGTRLFTALPLFWTAGLNTAMGSTLAAGGCWVTQEIFDPGEALALMARERVTEPYTLPHQTAALEEHPAWAATDLSSLRCVYGKSAFARHPRVEGDTTWNMPVGWGLSETCAFFTAHPADAPRHLLRESMGRLLPGNRLRVLDPASGQPLPPGEEGELAIAGPTMMANYLDSTPEECFDADGFLHTGDGGFVDAEGYVHFTGRRTEMIKTGGANVSPAELEVALRACPPVKLARVVGMPHDRLGQVVVACITTKDGAETTEADIQAFLRERVAAYKVPKRVLFFAEGEIPMTASDTKVRDAELVALATDRLAETTPQPSTSGDQR